MINLKNRPTFKLNVVDNMQFNDLLNSSNIYIDAVSQSRTAVLMNLSQVMHECYPALDAKQLFDAYLERENLGSTAIGRGILIPHICMPSIHNTHACFIKLQNPVDFNAEDKQPVDLIFGLASATDAADQHLQTLSRIVTAFSEPSFTNACRTATSQQELFDILTTESVPAI